MSINKVILVGNVGKDPEVRYVDSKPVATFSLATSERPRRNAQGVEIPERVEWHNIVMWGDTALFAEKYIRKGTRLYIEGRLRYRTWTDRNAIRHDITEIYCETFEMLSRRE